jgi:tetratricopeptide (TPR) repeat protein
MFRRSRRGRPASGGSGGESNGLPHDPDAMNALGVMLTDEGRLDEAEYLLRRAVAVGDVNALNNLGNVLEVRGDKPGAAMYWRQAAERGLPTAMCNLATYLATTGQLAEADSWYRKARSNAPGDQGLSDQDPAGGEPPVVLPGNGGNIRYPEGRKLDGPSQARRPPGRWASSSCFARASNLYSAKLAFRVTPGRFTSITPGQRGIRGV